MSVLDREYGVQVVGTPAPKGSMRCIGQRGQVKHCLVEDNDDTAPWRSRIELAGRKFPVAGLAGPVGVEVTITIARPKSHYRTGRNTHLLKATAPAWPHRSHASAGGNGDADKFGRNVLDGLADAGLYGNDIQVVELMSRKCYPDTPRCPDRLPRPGAVIRIYPIEEW